MVGGDRERVSRAGVRVEAGGDVDGEEARRHRRLRASLSNVMTSASVPSIWARAARAEQRVDHELGTCRGSSRAGRLPRARSIRPRERLIGTSRSASLDRFGVVLAARLQEGDGYVGAPVLEVAGGDEAVAAVVAGAAEDEDPAVCQLAEEEPGLLCDGEAGVLHELLDGNAGVLLGGCISATVTSFIGTLATDQTQMDADVGSEVMTFDDFETVSASGIVNLAVAVGGSDELAEAVFGAEGAVFAFEGEAGGDFAVGKLHAANGVDVLLGVGRRMTCAANSSKRAAEALQGALAEPDELDAGQVGGLAPDIGRDQYLVALGLRGERAAMFTLEPT